MSDTTTQSTVPAPTPNAASSPTRSGITPEWIRTNPTLNALIRVANEELGAQGFTEHGQRHAHLVSHISENILGRLGYPPRSAELAAIAGYLHDLGNAVNRANHPVAGATFCLTYLITEGMEAGEAGVVAGAIGNHEEPIGEPVSAPSAAVIIADKSDVHRSRVRNTDPATFDIHDRVNYAVQHSFVRVDAERRVITLDLTIDTTFASVTDYFEIFLQRMLFIRKAAQFLGCQFQLVINKTRMM
jgi:metal-dependent HD superfamily phosphatase/phosphodiesterase